MEHDQWSKALKTAEGVSDRLSDNYWRRVQLARLFEEQANGYTNLMIDTFTSLEDLKKGLTALKGILHATSCISLYSLADCGLRRLNDLGDGSTNEITERILFLKEYFQSSTGYLNTEIGQENDELTGKILENESKEECKLALLYVKEVVRCAAQVQFQEMSISNLEEESKSGFTNTRKKIKTDLIDHLILMVAVLTLHQAELEQVLKETAESLTTATITQLKKKQETQTSRLLPESSLRCVTKPSGNLSWKYHLEAERACKTQAADFLIRRKLHVMRLQAVEAEYQKYPECYQSIAKNTDKDSRKTYEKYFNDIPHIPIVERTPKLAERFKFQFADVYARKLLHPDKKIKRQHELDRFQATIKKERESCLTKLTEMTDVLTNVVCRLAPGYAKSLNKEQLQEIKNKNYSKTAKDLTPKVLSELSKGEENIQLQNETKIYFRSGDKISKAISI